MNMEGETICGYYVSPEQKKINAVYIDLILEFSRLCQQAGLTWWLYYGALIGAVRHKGFIPWDDDVDLLMPRADFERLRTMTNEEFGVKEPYFLQNFRTEPACVNALIRFRRSDTADIRPGTVEAMRRKGQTEPPYNLGINLAVFPLDGVPRSLFVRKLQSRAVYTLWGLYYRSYEPDDRHPLKHRVAKAVCGLIGGGNVMRLVHWLYRAPKRYRPDLLQSFDGMYRAPTIWPAEDFRETIQLPFEDIQVPVPTGYDEILTITYGDYMQFPPEEKRTSPHGGIMDADRPYGEVLAELLQNA